MAALGAAVIAAGGLVGFLAYLQTGQRTPVLAISHAVPAGEIIQDADLTEAPVELDPALKPYPASERGSVVGKRAAVSLAPGGMLSHGQVTDRTLVGANEQLVGIGLKASQLPATPLSAGDRVEVVSTPADGEQQAAPKGGQEAPPRTIPAKVVRVGKRDQATGDVVVDVAVQSLDGPTLAARAASGNVALVVDPAGKGGGS
ncbi:SAF domain-containing protein [Streptomyces sp. NPDC050161]|uniref:SAF domain-containing protein n=1 Tax=Streptomyces sp. NPDC050161 TaxID=3365604 RepID=UPI003793D528